MAMSPPQELYTAKTLFTLSGASFSVVALTGALSNSFGWSPKWLGLVFAEILAFVGLSLLPRAARRIRVQLLLLAFCNGLLIYTQATGFNSLNQGIKTPAKEATLIPFLDTKPWWPPADQKVAADNMVSSTRAVIQSISEFKSAHQTDSSLPPDLLPTLNSWQEQLTVASDNLAGSYEVRSTQEDLASHINCDCDNSQAPNIGGAATRQCLGWEKGLKELAAKNQLTFKVENGKIVAADKVCEGVTSGPNAWPVIGGPAKSPY